MKIQSLLKLDLLAVIEEQKILEMLMNHEKTLQRYIDQKNILFAYQERLNESWRNGNTVNAGDARRTTKFVTQVSNAYKSLIDSIEIEQKNKIKCEHSLADIRLQKKALLKQINTEKQIEKNKILKKIDQISFQMPSSSKNSSFFSS